MVWQYSNSQTSAREVVRQLQASLAFHQQAGISTSTGGYCRARKRFDVGSLERALTATADTAEKLTQPRNLLLKRRLLAVDGTTLTLPDSPANRARYPVIQTQDASGFPMMRVGLISSLSSGAVIGCSYGSLKVSELALLKKLKPVLCKGDVFTGDRLFGCFPAIAWLQGLGVDFIGRTTRTIDPKNVTTRFSDDDWLTQWERGAKPSPWLSPEESKDLPKHLTVRVIRRSIQVEGFRPRTITLVTTLLDPVEYPADQIFEAYLLRWKIEMMIDDIKTTLKLEMLQGKSPNVVAKELLTGLVVHNFIRCTMAKAANRHDLPLDRVSFKGTVDATRQFTPAIVAAKTKKKRLELWEEMLKTIAADLLPERPGRSEPRAVKRKKNKYPKLKGPRSTFIDPPKRNKRRKNARLRKQSLK
jgi:hypothetical protein